MKKIFTIVGTILSISLVVLGVLMLLVPKTAATAEDFEALMVEKGYSTFSAGIVIDKNSLVENALLAVSPDGSYTIEFYDFTSNKHADDFFNTNQQLIESARGNSYTSTSSSVSNFSKFTLSSNGKFYAVAVIGDTGIYVTADAEYKDAIKEALKELGY